MASAVRLLVTFTANPDVSREIKKLQPHIPERSIESHSIRKSSLLSSNLTDKLMIVETRYRRRGLYNLMCLSGISFITALSEYNSLSWITEILDILTMFPRHMHTKKIKIRFIVIVCSSPDSKKGVKIDKDIYKPPPLVQ